MEYKNIQVNQEVTFQNEKLQGCYITTEMVMIDNVTDLTAMYMLNIYKSKEIYEINDRWTIITLEIPNNFAKQFEPDFLSGDLFEKIANEIKQFILVKNPTWLEENIIIE